MGSSCWTVEEADKAGLGMCVSTCSRMFWSAHDQRSVHGQVVVVAVVVVVFRLLWQTVSSGELNWVVIMQGERSVETRFKIDYHVRK